MKGFAWRRKGLTRVDLGKDELKTTEQLAGFDSMVEKKVWGEGQRRWKIALRR